MTLVDTTNLSAAETVDIARAWIITGLAGNEQRR
jgi:hypothetical protein